MTTKSVAAAVAAVIAFGSGSAGALTSVSVTVGDDHQTGTTFAEARAPGTEIRVPRAWPFRPTVPDTVMEGRARLFRGGEADGSTKGAHLEVSLKGDGAGSALLPIAGVHGRADASFSLLADLAGVDLGELIKVKVYINYNYRSASGAYNSTIASVDDGNGNSVVFDTDFGTKVTRRKYTSLPKYQLDWDFYTKEVPDSITSTGTAEKSTGHYSGADIRYDMWVPNGSTLDLSLSTEQHGFAYVSETSLTVAAVPEPSTYAIALAGLAVIGGVARRRRQGG